MTSNKSFHILLPCHQKPQSLQRLSSSASNNRLKTCLQFLIIKVNEKSIPAPSSVTDAIVSGCESLKSQETKTVEQPLATNKHHQTKRQKSYHQQQRQQQKHLQKQEHNQLASPPQDQVSSTQDQVAPTQDDHDCQTSPMISISSQLDTISETQTIELKQLQDSPSNNENQTHSSPRTESSPQSNNYAPTTTHTSPIETEIIGETVISCQTDRVGQDDRMVVKRERDHMNSDRDISSTASWSSSYISPPSPMSTSSESSITSSSSHSSSSCSSPSCSPSPLSSPDIINDLRGPRLKLTEEKIRKIKRRPVLFDDEYVDESFASTPTTSSGCSPGQHSNTTQNSDQSRSALNNGSAMTHMFQAPPRFVNSLKPCNLPANPRKSPTPIKSPTPTKEMLNCAICGIKDRPPNITKVYGQNSCALCSGFFATFLDDPRLLYCAQDGDCLMTFDSRCQACWIKICLQKFEIQDEHRKIGLKFSPKLLSSPNVSLITIDTSSTR